MSAVSHLTCVLFDPTTIRNKVFRKLTRFRGRAFYTVG